MFCEICSKQTKHQRVYRAALWSCEFADTHPANLHQKYAGTVEELKQRLADADTYLDERLTEVTRLRDEVQRLTAMLPGPEHTCTGGWRFIQHPAKPAGVMAGVVPCPICNQEGQRIPNDPFSPTSITLTVTEPGDPTP
jgi:hypothetical protein